MTTMLKSNERGQALIEFALILPLLFLLIINVVNVGNTCRDWITVSNAARAGAVYLSMGPASASGPVTASAAAVKNLLTGTSGDLSSLLHYNDTTYTKVFVYGDGVSGADGAGPADLENSSLFSDCSVRVEYLSKPLIPFWDFPNLGVHLTWPPPAGVWIKKTARTRMLQ
jgi:hypothetical protein